MRDDFLSRWSRRKLAARAGREPPPAPVVAPPADAPAEARAPAQSPIEPPATAAEPAPLPPLESLTPESDFTPFMRADVDPATRRQALKTLFADPQFNVMDGLDVYIDDYSKPDPLPEGWLAKMNQVARLGEYIAPAAEDPAGHDPVNPDAAAAVQPEKKDDEPDSTSESEALPTDKG